MVWLSVLIFIALIAVITLNFRRQAKAREAASAKRLRAFMEQARSGAAGAHAEPAVLPVAQTTQTASVAIAARDVTLCAALLDADQAVIYGELKRALPDHTVFARVSLAAVVAPAPAINGFACEAMMRKLANSMVDFVVCDGAFRPMAVVQGATRAGKPAGDMAYARSCAAGAGVRWVELPAQAGPVGAALRQQVLGL